jgi:hypothetical protein
MKRYYVQCPPGRIEYFEIIADTGDGFLVRLTRIDDGDRKVLEERMSHDLFEICIKTGYIYQIEDETGTRVA